MNTTQLLLIVAVIAAAVVAAAWFVIQNRRRQHLKQRFGPEYDRAVRDTGNPSKAEAMLSERERRVEKLHLHPLAAHEAQRFSGAWKQVQSRFVDDPKAAVADADRLITEVMAARGYPMADWEQRVADISVEHPRVCDNYRRAHEIALCRERGQASTEDLRQGMVYYRDLFDELVTAGAAPAEPAAQRRVG
jgi:hypothetical protein